MEFFFEDPREGGLSKGWSPEESLESEENSRKTSKKKCLGKNWKNVENRIFKKSKKKIVEKSFRKNHKIRP